MTKDQFQTALGQQIKAARKSSGLSQATVARRIRLSRTAIVNIEAGRVDVPIWTLARIAAACQVELWRLVKPESETP